MLNRKIAYLFLIFHLSAACSMLKAEDIRFLRPPEYSSYYNQVLPYSELKTIDLSGEWRYLKYRTNNWKSVVLPASWENFSGKVQFRKNFTLDSLYLKKQVRLVGLGISGRCRILLNDEFIIEQEGPYLDIILPNKLFRKSSANTLEIEIDNKLSSSKSIPLRSGAIIPENYGGITGDIFLVIEDLPDVSLQNVEVDYDTELESGVIRLKTLISKSMQQNYNLKLSLRLLTDDNQDVKEQAWDLGKENNFEAELTLRDPLTWSTENPNLYKLEVSLLDSGTAVSKKSLQIGFKQFDTAGEILLNGEKIQLKGIKYRPVHQYGLTFSANDFERDLELMVSAGANALLVNDPPHPYLLKLCDEAGIIVLQSNSVEVLPNAILEQAKFQSLLEERMNRIYSTLHYHPSICGWLIGLDLEPNFANYISFTDLELLPGSSLFAGVNTGRKKIVRVSPGHTESIFYDVGPVLFGDDEKQQMRQVSILSQDLNNLRDAGGIFISEFADFKSGRNILFQQINLPHDKVYHCGLVKRDRSTRIAFRELQRGWFDQEIIEAVDSESKEAFLYPIFGFSLLLIIIIYTRSNHVFRVQLARVFNHPHGFYHDVKNKRFIQKMQTFILGFCAILVMALIASSLLYSQRFSIEFDFISALLFQNCYLHTILLTIVNNAWASILYMSILFLLSLFFVTIIFKLTTLIFGQNITFGQSIIYACWAGANFLLLSPLTIIFYKGLSYSLFAKLEIVVVLIFLFWTFSRLLIALRVAASSTVPRVFLCFVGIHLLLVLIIGTILQYQNSFIQYLGYLFNPKI